MSDSKNRDPRSHGGPVSRRGAVALLAVVLMLTMLTIVGVVVEMCVLYHVEIQLHGAADAATLAGAAELIDEDVLYPNRPADQRDDVARARKIALAYAASNHVAGTLFVCDANDENRPDGDLVFGWLDDPADHGAAMVLSNGERPCNTLQVIAQRTRHRGNPVHLWFTSILGFAEADARCLSRATVDQRVYGFRTTRECDVPMVPLTLRGEGTAESWAAQALASPLAGVNDRFTVDDRTGEVQAGPDGIPEVMLRFPLDSAEDAGEASSPPTDADAGLLAISDSRWVPMTAVRQLREGLRPSDLQAFGDEFALDESGRLFVAGAPEFDKRIVRAIGEIRGAKRIWPLYRNRHHRAATEVFEVTGFAAGRIVDVRLEPDGATVVFVQACVLITPTALVRPLAEGQKRNPWIGKLSLTL